MRVVVFGVAVWLTLSFAAAAQDTVAYRWNLPAWAAPPAVPTDNPMSIAKVALGRYLFYDKRLSGNRTYSCGTCHIQRYAFSEPRMLAIGSTGQRHPRRSETLTNVAYNTALTWANPNHRKLEEQLLVPMFGRHPVELGLSTERALLARLERDMRYRRMFAAAFPGDANPFSMMNVAKAIASFERTLISFDSPYDRYRYGGESNAIGEDAKRGETLFFSERLACARCHSGVNFSDDAPDAHAPATPPLYHNIGLYNIGGSGKYPEMNAGVFAVTGDLHDMGKFKTPTLRNVAAHAPYMHDGSVADLNAVVEAYQSGGRAIASGPLAGDGSTSPYKDQFIHKFAFSASERADLIAFLKTLTDEHFLTNPALSNPFPPTP